MKRRSGLITVAAVVAALMPAIPLSAAAAEPRQPDLGMARLSDFAVATTAGGQQQLRFSATIVNVGAGPFELAASRPAGGTWSVNQLTSNTDGSKSSAPADVGMVYGGDGHGHWHIQDLENYELDRLDNGKKVGTGVKSGFCFFDTTPYRLSLPGAPGTAQYGPASCGEEDAVTVSMGLSVGWGDKYPWSLPDQYIDITGLANGKYRLVATADANGKFTESDEGNNATYVDLQLSSRKGVTSVKVLRYGPAA